MEPNDRLWAQLIFPWCDAKALLRLRIACRGFLAQLHDSRLWLPWTMELPQLRYDERVEGWRGVLKGMQREAKTKASCDAGHVEVGPLLEVPAGYKLFHVAGRIAAHNSAKTKLFNIETGSLLASFDVEAYFQCAVVQDRWVVFFAKDGRGMLLDCLSGRLLSFAHPRAHRDVFDFSVAGACFSHRAHGSDTTVSVTRLEGGPDGATVVRALSSVVLARAADEFSLCDSGRSYMRFDAKLCTLHRMDMATHQLKRVFTMRKRTL